MTYNRFERAAADLDVLEESALAVAQATICNAMDAAHVTRADLARRLDRSRSFITRILQGNHNLTVKTFARVMGACGYELRFQRLPISWSWSLEPTVESAVEQPSPDDTYPIAA